MASGVVFDLFGTLLAPRERLDPYKTLIVELSRRGARFSKSQTLSLMRGPVGLRQTWSLLAPELSPDEPFLAQLEIGLERELQSVALFSDTLEALDLLRQRSIPFTVCSNLAAPYARSLSLLPRLSAPAALSFETGLLKPDRAMFENACARLGLAPGDCAMVGDRIPDDIHGALGAGMSAILIDRADRSGSFEGERRSTLVDCVKAALGRAPSPR